MSHVILTEWLYPFIVCFCVCVFNIHYLLKRCMDSVIWLLHSWCHMKLLLSQCVFWKHHTTMRQFTMALNSKPCNYVQYMCVKPSAFLAKWPGCCTCYCGNTESTQKVDPGEEHSPAAQTCWDSNLHPFNHKFDALTTLLSLLPKMKRYTCTCWLRHRNIHLKRCGRQWKHSNLFDFYPAF